MPKIWGEDSAEADFSILLRAVAVWTLATAAMTAQLLARDLDHFGVWVAFAIIAAGVLALGALIFFTYPPGGRLLSAAMLTGQSAVMQVMIIWITRGDDHHGNGLLGVVVMSLVVAWRLRHDNRAVRAGETTGGDS